MNTITLAEIEKLIQQRDNLLSSCKELTDAMIDYQMLSEGEQTHKHRKMMERAYAAIMAATEGGT